MRPLPASPTPGIVRMDREIREQHLRNAQRLEARVHRSALRCATNRIPDQINAARPAAVSIAERLQQRLSSSGLS